MLTRRQVLELGALASAYFLPLLRGPGGAARFIGKIAALDPKKIPKYAMPLLVPPAMPRTGVVNQGAIDYYRIGVRQLRQQVLPPHLPKTTVWGYSAALAVTSPKVKIPALEGCISIWRLWNCATVERWPIETIVVRGSFSASAS